MKDKFIQLLCCPFCLKKLSINSFRLEANEIIDGILYCSCGEWFPVIRGIPRMLQGELKDELVLSRNIEYYHNYKRNLPDNIVNEWTTIIIKSTKNENSQQNLKKKTASSFGYEWKTFNKLFEVYRTNFLNYIDPIKEDFFQNKLVLDAGCGVGRHSYWAAKFGAHVVAMDLSDAVEETYRNCRGLNVDVVQADILNPPFGRIFDFVFSIGVLHHLPDPEKGFRSLMPRVKHGGTYAIWVYGKKNNFSNVYVYETLRLFTRPLPHKLLYYLCYIPAFFVQMFNYIFIILNKISLTKNVARHIPFSYYVAFPFEVKVNDSFDVLATPKSTYWSKEEIEKWYNQVGIKNARVSYLRRKSLKAYGIVV